MGAYFVPLRMLIPKVLGISTDKIPIPGDLEQRIGVRDVREVWNDTHTVMTGRAVVDADVSFELFGLTFLFGDGAADQLEVRFEYTTDRVSMVDFLLAEGADAVGVDLTPEEQASPSLLLDAPPTRTRVVVRDLGLRLRLPAEHCQLGQLVPDSVNPTGITPAPGDPPVDIVLPGVVLTIDTIKGVSLAFAEDEALDVPPILIRGLGVGFEIDKVKIDLSETDGFREVLSRPGFDRSWRGLHIEKARVFGLDKLLPFLPGRVDPDEAGAFGLLEMSDWIIGSEGFTGSIDLRLADLGTDGIWKGAELGVEFDHGELVRGTAGVTLRAGQLDIAVASIGPDGDLALAFTLRRNRAMSGAEAWGFDVSVRAPGTADSGLLALTKDRVEILETGLFVALETIAVATGGEALGIAGALLGVAAAAQETGILTLEKLILDGLTVRYYPRLVAGEVVRFLEFVLDVQLSVKVSLPIPSLVEFQTDEPLGVRATGIALRFALNPGDHEAALDAEGLDAFQFDFSPESGIDFDTGKSSFVRLGTLFKISKLGLGRWDEGIWFDLGLQSVENVGNVAFDASGIRLYFKNDGDYDHYELTAAGVTLLVPGTIYLRGSLSVGDVTTAALRAFLVGNGTATTNEEWKLRSAWLWEAAASLRQEELPDGETSVVVSAELNNSSGIALGTSGVSVYGLYGHFATNARADVTDGDWGYWYRVRDPKNQIEATKFRGESGTWGFGLGLVFGSSDGGRAWNAKAGLMLELPGPVIVLAGTANVLFSPRAANRDSSEGALSAILVLDFREDLFRLTAVVSYKAPSDGKLITIGIPVDVLVSCDDPGATQWHVYLGEHWPLERRARASVFSSFDASAYIMVDGSQITNLANTGVDIPGVACALGAAIELDWGLKSDWLKCYLYAAAAVDAAVSLPDPWLIYGHLHLEGGLVVKVCGFGFEFVVYADFNVIAPDPFRLWGELGIRIGLPWPLPDVDESVPFELGDEGIPPEPAGNVTGELTIHPRGDARPKDLPETGADEIPIDPTFTLTFPYSVRNADAELGNFRFASTDDTTWHPTSGGDGYRFTLSSLVLEKRVGGSWEAVPGPIPAVWVPEAAKGPMGTTARRVLQLFAYEGLIQARYIGTGATYVDAATSGWDPCPEAVRTTPVCYRVDDEALGPLAARQLVEAAGATPMVVQLHHPGPVARTLRSMLGITLERAEVEAAPIAISHVDVRRVLRLPAAIVPQRAPIKAFGLWAAGGAADSPGVPLERQIFGPKGSRVAATVGLKVPRALALVLDLLVDPKGSVLWVSAEKDGTFHEIAATDLGPVADAGDLSAYHHLRYTIAGPVERVHIAAAHVTEVERATHAKAWLYRACTVPLSALVAAREAARTSSAWNDFWSDLLSTGGASSDALILEPDTDYRLSVEMAWGTLHAEEVGGTASEVATGTRSASWTFHTTSTPPGALRPQTLSADVRLLGWDPATTPFDASFDGLSDDWDVASAPRDGAVGVYASRPLRLVFRDPRTELVFGAFDRRLVLRLVDEEGSDAFDRLEFLRENAPALPEYQRAWQKAVVSTDCTPADATSLWSIGVAVFGSVLAPDRWYDADLVPVPTSVIPDLSAVDWSSYRPVHRFRFRTSRWGDLATHLGAFVVYDEVATVGDLEGAIGITSGLLRDDAALDSALGAALGLPLRPPPPDPELVRIWREDAGGVLELVGILLDGPEALLRSEDALDVAIDGGSAEFVLVQGESRARSLVLLRSGGAWVAPAGATLRLRVRDPWVDSAGALQEDTAEREIDIGGPDFVEG